MLSPTLRKKYPSYTTALGNLCTQNLAAWEVSDSMWSERSMCHSYECWKRCRPEATAWGASSRRAAEWPHSLIYNPVIFGLRNYSSGLNHGFCFAGKVNGIKVAQLESGISVVKREVSPSQRMGKPYKWWIGVRPCGEILDAQCACMAG